VIDLLDDSEDDEALIDDSEVKRPRVSWCVWLLVGTKIWRLLPYRLVSFLFLSTLSLLGVVRLLSWRIVCRVYECLYW
jgi:hypothetical protein